MNNYQKKQIEIINKIEEDLKAGLINLSSVPPVEDFEKDNRICLTTVHIPNKEFKQKIESDLIQPLREFDPNQYYYSNDSLHITIKSIRTINNPPTFTNEDVIRVENLLDEIIPKHKKFNAYYYRLFLFPTNLALMGTTDEELDNIILDFDEGLKK